MATPFTDISRLFSILNPPSTIIDPTKLDDMLEFGIINAGIEIDRDYTIDMVNEQIVEDLTNAERMLCALCTYRVLAVAEHKDATSKATNFKTINFAVTGLTEKAKEYMRIVWWCGEQIESTRDKILKVVGNASQVGDING